MELAAFRILAVMEAPEYVFVALILLLPALGEASAFVVGPVLLELLISSNVQS